MQAHGGNTHRGNQTSKGLADGSGPHRLAGLIGEDPVVDWRAATDPLELCVLLSRVLHKKTDGFDIEVDRSAAVERTRVCLHAGLGRRAPRAPLGPGPLSPPAGDGPPLPNRQESALDV